MCVCDIFLIQSSANEHLGWIHTSAIVTWTAINTDIQITPSYVISFHLAKFSEEDLLEPPHHSWLLATFLQTCLDFLYMLLANNKRYTHLFPILTSFVCLGSSAVLNRSDDKTKLSLFDQWIWSHWRSLGEAIYIQVENVSSILIFSNILK